MALVHRFIQQNKRLSQACSERHRFNHSRRDIEELLAEDEI